MNHDKFIRDTDDLRELEEAQIERELNPDFALISDYVIGELSPEKASEVRERLETDPEFRDLAEPLLLAYSVPRKTKPMSHEELLRSWLQLRRRAGMPPVPGQEDVDETEELKRFYERQRAALVRQTRRRILLTAALFLVVLGLPAAGIWWNAFQAEREAQRIALTAQTATTEVKTWQELTIPLPDGSTARLAPATRLRHNPTFASGREVQLIGEGRFEVKAGASVFTVITDAAEISVEGTSFTVSGFERAATTVIVHEGRVRVRGRFDDPKVASTALILKAGQKAIVLRNTQPELLP